MSIWWKHPKTGEYFGVPINSTEEDRIVRADLIATGNYKTELDPTMTKTKSQKARAREVRKIAAVARKPVAKPKGRKKKWHLAVGTPWGSLSAGSGDKAQQMASRSRNKIRDAYTMQMAPNPTTIDRGGAGTKQRIRQKELVGTLNGTSAFVCQSWLLQPGLANNFPWLSKIAGLYQRYKFTYLRFFFKSIVSQYADMGKQGRIVMCCDYDAVASNCTTLQQAEGLNPNVPGIPYQDCSLELNPARLTPGAEGKFTRTGIPPAGTDLKTYDAGMLMICTDGCFAGDQIGELHVEYEVELMDPILPNTAPPSKAVWVSSAILASVAAVNGVDTQVPFGSWSVPSSGNIGNGLGLDTLGGGIVMPEGVFEVTFDYTQVATVGMTYSDPRIAVDGSIVRSQSRVDTAGLGTVLNGQIRLIRKFLAGETITVSSYTNFASGTLGLGGYLTVALV